MKNRRWIRLLSFSLVLCMFVMQVGCATTKTTQKKTVKIEPMEAEESVALSFDIIGGKDVMPVGGFFGPYAAAYAPKAQPLPDFNTDEYIKAIADAGVNLIEYTPSDTTGEYGNKLLDLCEKYGIGLFANDPGITAMKGKDNIPSLEQISDMLSLYRTHPAFCGLYVVDEPGGKDYWTKPEGNNMEDYQALNKMLREECGVDIYTNLIRLDAKHLTAEYESYLKEYCETMTPSFMSFDLYLWSKGNTKSIFLCNLALARKYAQEYKLPLWNYIACGDYFDGQEAGEDFELNPLEGEFDWSINTSLAYGTQGIQYFMIFQPFYFATTSDPEVFEFTKNGMFGARGNKNAWYYYAQDISKQISAIDAVLMNSVNKGVIASGSEAIGDTKDSKDVMLEGTSWRELADVKGNALVGCFNYQGKTALYVVNYDAEYAQDVTLEFYDSYKMQVTQDGKTDYLDTSSLTLNMKAGDGVLIVMK